MPLGLRSSSSFQDTSSRPAALALAEAAPPARLRRREATYGRLLGAADAIGIAVVLSLLAVTRDVALQPAAALALPGVVLVAKVLGLYDRDDLLIVKRSLDEAPDLLQVATLVTVLGWLLGGALAHPALAPAAGAELWAGTFFALLVTRRIARLLARRLTGPERILVVGDEAAAARLRPKLTEDPHAAAELVGHFAPTENGRDELAMRVAELKVDRVVVAPREQTEDEVLDVIRMVKGLGVRVSILPRLFEVVGSSVVFDSVGGLTLLGLRPLGLTASSRFVKRSLDLAGALVGLLLLSPLLAILAVAVKLDSPGPVLFGQLRVGRDGRRFCTWKFRTMVADAEERKAELVALNEGADGFFKIADDPRIIRVGRFLRRTSLDELPQLLNVVRGEMSLVGPRPLIEEEDRRVEGWYRRRLHLTPGMTGHWQVLGSSRVPLAEMVVLDYLYVANWSLWGDIKILLRTLPRVCRAGNL